MCVDGDRKNFGSRFRQPVSSHVERALCCVNLGESAVVTEVLDFAGDEANELQVGWNEFLLGGGGGGFLLLRGEALLEPWIVGVVVVGGGGGFRRRKKLLQSGHCSEFEEIFENPTL